jgi:hypothetical protein
MQRLTIAVGTAKTGEHDAKAKYRIRIKLLSDAVLGPYHHTVTSYVTDHSLNLSILLSEGKETNRDFISSGERT